ncbi:multiple sugar transport system permease protein [Microbacterium endophyticum]|uniref:Multiple sugar transport system permease protein n=1 Tax=Microbacterium endophyticum TaxID=1526412 RepID=A0A7W4V5B4_9MICO|nr:sugar ABC transporter permease [Microbacterium endophyticum]MBB2977132.1 multiple sugar transport system permease protein [Microbacterium endophyticum]NIK36060.1 multiple sugar transport system permease protein [Microbacterium endophyticum]
MTFLRPARPPKQDTTQPVKNLKRRNYAGPLMASPALILLFAFLVVPFIGAIVMSFFRIQLGSPRAPRFVGFEQYIRLFADPDISATFLRSLGNNFTFALVVVPLQTVLALGLAILINRKLRGMTFFRTVFFMPLVFPLALVAVIWRLIFARDEYGLLNGFLGAISGGLIQPHDWLGDANTALGAIIVMSVWQSVAFQMIILLGALQGVPKDLYEAASLDRANGWSQFVHVTVPGIRNTLIFVALLTMIFSFRLFDQVYLLDKSSSLNIEATQTVMYQVITTGYDQNNVGQGAAMAVVFFIIVAIVAIVQRRLVRQEGGVK